MTYSLEQANAYANQKLGAILGWPEVSDDGNLVQSTYTGDEFAEIRQAHVCRHNEVDAKVACDMVLSQFQTAIECALTAAGEKAKIHWRIRPEVEVIQFDLVVKHHDDGPDKDHITDKRCTFDKGFWMVKAYCRAAFVTATQLNARKLYLISRAHEHKKEHPLMASQSVGQEF